MVRDRPYYSLKKVKFLVSEKKCSINDNARRTARKDFGWGAADIKKALSRLQPKHFYKSDSKYDDPTVYVDYYKARDLMGENLYIHFRIEKGCLIICSFKEI